MQEQNNKITYNSWKIPGLQHVLDFMYHIFGLKLISVVKLLVYRVDDMIWVIPLSSPTPVSYLTTSLSGDK